MSENLNYKTGLNEGLPIALGYLGPSIAIAVLYVASGLGKLFTTVIGALIYTVSGQGALLKLFNCGIAEPLNCVVIILLVNCRYIILSLALGQRLESKTTILQRMAFGFFNTDEIFGIAMQKPGKLPIDYMFGLVTLPYIFQIGGLIIGVLLGNILPTSIKSAFGIVLSAMFISIVVSNCKKSASMANTVIIAIVISWALEEILVKIGVKIEDSLIILICSLLSSIFSAIFYPINDEEEAIDKVSEEID